MPKIKFTVDSALLRELGERLVGRPHVALAELIKNSYDADANAVLLRFSDDYIEVIDNGHGMTFDEFQGYWMRIGTAHKQKDRQSRRLHRPLTGSKGVGRLAAQFLAKKLTLRTVSESSIDSELNVSVDWEAAVAMGDLTEATADYSKRKRKDDFPGSSSHGTAIRLSELNQTWSSDSIIELAKQIWMLQPPFGGSTAKTDRTTENFRIILESDNPADIEQFESQMTAALQIWHARIVGKLTWSRGNQKSGEAVVNLALQHSDGTTERQSYSVPACNIEDVSFEIRVFHLKHRQPHGVEVNKARDYLNQFGGVHIYDAGFRLPYYGLKESDWLEVEMDHSHRLSRSKLLPEHMQVVEAMNYLPTTSRLYGVVNVNTSAERQYSDEGANANTDILTISVTRDRLIDNGAFRQLQRVVRWAIDFYAVEEAKRALRVAEANRPTEPSSEKLERVESVLESHRDEIPKGVYTRLRSEISDAVAANEAEEEYRQRQSGLLGALATAGMTALSFEHELNREIHTLEAIVDRFKRFETRHRAIDEKYSTIVAELEKWCTRISSTRQMFSWLFEEENREGRRRYRAKPLLDDVKVQLAPFIRRVEVDTSLIPSTLRLPKGAYSEWSAIFQNVVTNAINATLDSPVRQIVFETRERRGRSEILVEDTGSGVDLGMADDLFKPFVRKLKISRDRQSLGLGGTGLGLAIVRMIAETLHCRVTFVDPNPGYKTAFCLSWKDSDD